jgi:uncharacterized protein
MNMTGASTMTTNTAATQTLADTATPKPAALTVAYAQAVQAMSGDVPSPCVSICRMDELREFCVGCSRTLEELGQWRSMDNEDKKIVWALIAQRITAVPCSALPEPAMLEPVTS